MQFLQLLSILVTTAATVAIAVFSYRTYQIYGSMKEIMSQNQTETKDLYQAIVIATLLTVISGPGKIGPAIEIFKHHYRGKTQIFAEN
jgi:glucan phosphoethanolaminetransferase (alkaline phosphatase superfamily)